MRSVAHSTASKERIEMPTGIVKFYNEQKGFGFIARDDGQDDIFVHINSVDESVDTLLKEQRVSFEDGIDARRGKPEALNVRVIDVPVERVNRSGGR